MMQFAGTTLCKINSIICLQLCLHLLMCGVQALPAAMMSHIFELPSAAIAAKASYSFEPWMMTWWNCKNLEEDPRFNRFP
jgi:hypothetical protein